MSQSSSSLTLIYDGACPFCSTYARYMRLKDTAGTDGIVLVNARDGGPLVEQAWKKYDLNRGMLAIMGGREYYGEEALHILALLSSRSGWFNNLNYALFRHETIARMAYPFLRLGRNLALLIKGEKQIDPSQPAGSKTI